ncbi:hypothetical protein [Sporichthya sp.]|uniref:hypothetical protein n=1 Tax=Sporichthya sp. TaxID=65475 RepID=UPI0017F1818C|nr:hypothetical protein [Sporichthya sp.]MBA3742199.1 hypothetical protein [Sporichthya sp.]
MDAIHAQHQLEAENVRGDRGMIFLVGMAIAGMVTVFAALALVDSPAGAGTGTTPAQVSAR